MENRFQMNFTKAQVDAISNLGLAHVGDGVYELLVRRVSLGAHWVDSRESSLLRRSERGREIGR